MDHRELDDRALLKLARDGSAPAFAVLVYRHLHRVDRLIMRDADLVQARTKVFVRAMRKLDDAKEPFGAWIEELAASTLPVTPPADGTPHATDATASERRDDAPVGASADIDTLWRELALRWPNGRRPVQVPTIVGWLGTLVVTVALSAAVPWITLGQFANDQAIPALRAFPIDADVGVATPDEDEDEPDEAEPLPTYEFPVPPEEDAESDAHTAPDNTSNDSTATDGDATSEGDAGDAPSESDADDPTGESETQANGGGGGGGG